MRFTYDAIPPSVSNADKQGDDNVSTTRNHSQNAVFRAGGTFFLLSAVIAFLMMITTDQQFSGVVRSTPVVTPRLQISLKEESSVSSRGQVLKPGRNDMSMFAMGSADPYHPLTNKKGYLVMLVAENNLMRSEMEAKVLQVQQQQQHLPPWIFDYGDMGGQVDFKSAVANMMQKSWMSSIPQGVVDPNKLRFQSGAGTVLDSLAWCLAEENDGVLVTGPNYPAFGADFGLRGKVVLHVAPAQAANGYAPTVAELDECWQQSRDKGNPPKILIICQPNNPTGTIYSAEAMHLMITWALQRGLHVVSDEIYANSVFPGQHTTSAAHIMSELNPDDSHSYLGDKVHIVAGMSKDWGMSGFRVGTLFSHNEKLLQAMDILGYYKSVSQYTQLILTGIFQDEEWVQWYIDENQKRLEATFHALETALAKIDVPLFPSKGGLFAWADFSSCLRPGQSEKELWLELFEEARVAFTSGESCNGEKPGMFRVVYPWPEGGVEAMKELGERLVLWKAKRR